MKLKSGQAVSPFFLPSTLGLGGPGWVLSCCWQFDSDLPTIIAPKVAPWGGSPKLTSTHCDCHDGGGAGSMARPTGSSEPPNRHARTPGLSLQPPHPWAELALLAGSVWCTCCVSVGGNGHIYLTKRRRKKVIAVKEMENRTIALR